MVNGETWWEGGVLPACKTFFERGRLKSYEPSLGPAAGSQPFLDDTSRYASVVM